MRNYNWIDENEIPVRATLKVIHVNAPDYGLSQDEISDRNEFIRWYILHEFEALLSIPVQITETEFFIKDFEDSAFNTHDYYREHPHTGFNKYAYRMRRIMEKVENLAIIFSVLGSEQGRDNTQARYQRLVNREFKNRLVEIEGRLARTCNPWSRQSLMKKSAELKRRIMDCQKVWEQYAPP